MDKQVDDLLTALKGMESDDLFGLQRLLKDVIKERDFLSRASMLIHATRAWRDLDSSYDEGVRNTLSTYLNSKTEVAIINAQICNYSILPRTEQLRLSKEMQTLYWAEYKRWTF